MQDANVVSVVRPSVREAVDREENDTLEAEERETRGGKAKTKKMKKKKKSEAKERDKTRYIGRPDRKV